ncbi:MAG: YeeE/YedE family protein [Alphaproteobacteria bacterium]
MESSNRKLVAVALVLLGGGWAMLLDRYGWRHGALFLTGGALGLVLYHALFGFTSAWRAFLSNRRGDGLRAQMVMLALASAIFLPAIAEGSLFGQQVGGAIAPAGFSVLAGAFLFGIGMQLGGGCASGTLFAVGGGSVRMAVTLAAFIAGSVIGTLHAPWWYALPGPGSISLVRELGMGPALALQLAIFAAIYLASLVWERRRIIAPPSAATTRTPGRLLRGPWPLLWGAIALALLNALTLFLAGHPWSITFAFGLWGAKLLSAAGMDVAAWPFWTWPYPASALGKSLWADTTSVMNIGIVLGAFLAAALAGRFAPDWRVKLRPLAAALIGGLLLGYGARLAYGCNIGAFFSGVASGSLHGWLWFVSALAGNYLGLKFRRPFGLSV